MALTDEICTNEYITAMQASLEREKLETGAEPDSIEMQQQRLIHLQKTFTPFGKAIYQITTDHAVVISNHDTDESYWKWIFHVNTWLSSLASWQQGVTQAAANWDAPTPAEQALKVALMKPLTPVSPPTPPSSLNGRLQ